MAGTLDVGAAEVVGFADVAGLDVVVGLAEVTGVELGGATVLGVPVEEAGPTAVAEPPLAPVAEQPIRDEAMAMSSYQTVSTLPAYDSQPK